MIAKKHDIGNNTILAVCDKEHLGKTFEDGKISFVASKKFYGGTEISEEELLSLLDEASSANLFGNKCVSIAQKKGLISEHSVILISKVKHAQIYKL
jgi:uncharacterized protein